MSPGVLYECTKISGLLLSVDYIYIYVCCWSSPKSGVTLQKLDRCLLWQQGSPHIQWQQHFQIGVLGKKISSTWDVWPTISLIDTCNLATGPVFWSVFCFLTKCFSLVSMCGAGNAGWDWDSPDLYRSADNKSMLLPRGVYCYRGPVKQGGHSTRAL